MLTAPVVETYADEEEEEEDEEGSGRKLSDSRKPSGPGVDIFIDSVGGVFHSMVMEQMKSGGRVCILGEDTSRFSKIACNGEYNSNNNMDSIFSLLTLPINVLKQKFIPLS